MVLYVSSMVAKLFQLGIFFFLSQKDIVSPSEVVMIKMRDENIGERSKRVNSSPYFHRGRMSCILITSKMIV